MDTTGTMQKCLGITVLPESELFTVPSFGVNSFYLLFTLSVNVTPTNELWEDYKTLISAKTLCFITFFLILSLLPIQKGDMLYTFKCGYLAI